ncbi:hypothetical protein HCC36_16070 [Listeria booriae]|uniref:Uncharacterized protein n=1 Tax=Listeria booriae TaxID=1552123 RepID=A0A842GBI9_9LIST|nr:hypothetical protein [Listeria booriae]MBC2294740.1 hypothetical protein [Listeria booriae]
MEKWITLDARMRELGFAVGISSYVFTLDLSRQKMLVVEGEPRKGAIYYAFYLVCYAKERVSFIQVYGEDMPVVDMFKKVRSYMTSLNKQRLRKEKVGKGRLRIG